MREQEQPTAEDAPHACFICLSAEDEEAHGPEDKGRLQRRCKCNMYTHQNCLIRWQLQKAGQAEERHCRFCGSPVGDWREALKEQVTTAAVSAPKAYIGVVHKGTTFKVPVTVGPNAVEEFKARISELFSIPEGDYQVSFQCKSPVFGDSLQLSGYECFEAATHCAVMSACRRAKREEEERVAAAEAHEARKLARESKSGLSRLSRLFHVPQSQKNDSTPPSACDSSSPASKQQHGPAAALRRLGRSFASCFMPPHRSRGTVATELQQQRQQQHQQQRHHTRQHSRSSRAEERSTHSARSAHSAHSARAHRWSASFLSPLFERSGRGSRRTRASSRSSSPFRRASIARSSTHSGTTHGAPTLDSTSSRGHVLDTTSAGSTLDTISSRAALDSTSRVSRHSNYMYLQHDSRHVGKGGSGSPASSRPLASTSARCASGSGLVSAKGESLASTSSTLPGKAWGGMSARSAQQQVV